MSTSELMLSISGLRGIIGQSLTPLVAARYGAALGSWLKQSSGKGDPHAVIGRDSRPSGVMVQNAVAAGLIATGCRVTTLGIATTPGVAIMVEHLRADGGLVITASHNPIIWNGIKALRHDGLAPPPDQAAQIIDRFHRNDVSYIGVEKYQPVAQDDSAGRVHVDRILRHIDAAAIRRRRPKVVLDSVHGAGGPSTAMLLQELGAQVVHLYAEPTGRFPHTPEPTAENLTGLCAAVKQHGADIGLAQDPDADRLALVDEKGLYLGEEYTLALCALHVLGRDRGPVAANLSTSRMIDDVAAKFGVTAHRTPVGEAHVASAMRRHSATFGGEGNGGVIWPKIIHVRDSLGGIAIMLEMLATTGKSLSQIASSIPAYAIVKDKLPIQAGMAQRAIASLQTAFAGQRIDMQDGIRIDLPEGWVHVRASNTEPILRIIAEAADHIAAMKLIERVRKSASL